MRPRLEFGPEGFDIVFPGLAMLAAARRRVRVRYDQVEAAHVGPPERAPLLLRWRAGTHWPGAVEMGRFHHGGRKRLLFHGPRTARVLHLRLRDHAFTEASLDLADPEAALGELEMRRGPPR